MNVRTGVAVAAFVAVMASSAMADALYLSARPAEGQIATVCDNDALDKADRDQCHEQIHAATSDDQRARIRTAVAERVRLRQRAAHG